MLIQHAIDTQYNKRNTQVMTRIECKAFEDAIVNLRELDKEASDKDGGKTVSEEESSAQFLV
jgi:hypothetical protein